MGFGFSSFTKPFKKAAKAVAKVVVKTPQAISTGAKATGGGLESFFSEPIVQTAVLAGTVAFTGGSTTQLVKGLLPGGKRPTAQQPSELSGGGTPVGIGNLLSGLSGILGSTSQFGGNVGLVSTIGQGFLSGFLPAQGPVAGRPIASVPQVQAIQVMGGAPMIAGARSAIAEFVAPTLAKISAALGKNITLRAAMIIVRRLGKFLQSPAAIAAAIGLSVAELSTLLTAASIAGSSGKRMNVGNIKALRRAHRRIRGFHRVCVDNDELKRPRRRSTARSTGRTVGVVQVKN